MAPVAPGNLDRASLIAAFHTNSSVFWHLTIRPNFLHSDGETDMKKTIGTLIFLALITQLFLGTFQPGLAQESPGGMPGWPVPDKPIPHHEVGQRSKGADYSTQVM